MYRNTSYVKRFDDFKDLKKFEDTFETDDDNWIDCIFLATSIVIGPNSGMIYKEPKYKSKKRSKNERRK